MITIHLHKLEFWCFHGIHEEEKIIGGNYEVNADISYRESTDLVQLIDQTIDYTAVYTLIREKMEQPTPLLESLAMKIAKQLKEKYDNIAEISINVKKITPPVRNIKGSASVTYKACYS